MPHDPLCPFDIDRPVMRMRWEALTFLHWAYEADEVQRLLPPWLTVETYDGKAWIGLVPFFMRVCTGRGLNVPWASNFPETNLRTYVRDADGRSGVWFFSLDASRFGAVAVARASFGLPYFWSRMRVQPAGDLVTYESRRRVPGPRGAGSSVVVRVGEPFVAAELTDFDHFLTARWILFSPRRRFVRASHQPWPLRRATVELLDDELTTAAGLPAPRGDPLVHWSDGVDVRIGRPEEI